MKTNKDIENKVKNALEAFDSLEHVNVSPFFKDKTMQRLFVEKEHEVNLWSWFTPKLQLVALGCFILLNVFAVSRLSTETYDDNLVELADNFGMAEEESEISLLSKID